MNRIPYLIIGNSAAAIGGVAGIRSLDYTTPITVVAAEPHHTYSRPLISYLLGEKVDDAHMAYRPADFYETQGVEATLGVAVTSIDVPARTVSTDDGRTLAFEECLIATGGRPILPADVAGIDAEGVFTFTSLDDAHRIRKFINHNLIQHATVVGGGLIGLKSIEALTALGVRTTMVELADRMLSATFDNTASEMARASLEKAGVQVITNTTVSEIGCHHGKVATAVLRDGTTIVCSLVVFAVGVRPNVALLHDSGIEIDRGILVDEHLASSAEGIYAAGDVAQPIDMLTGLRRLVPILPAASRQGFIAGCNMAGSERTYEGGLAMNAVDICGLPTISVGQSDPAGTDCEVLTSSGSEGVYKKIVIKNNRIIGAIFIGQIDRAGIITGLIKDKVDVSSFKNLLLTDEFGLISLPEEYRKHIVAEVRVVL